MIKEQPLCICKKLIIYKALDENWHHLNMGLQKTNTEMNNLSYKHFELQIFNFIIS